MTLSIFGSLLFSFAARWYTPMLQSVAVCCSFPCCSLFQSVAVFGSILQTVAVLLQSFGSLVAVLLRVCCGFVAVCCSVAYVHDFVYIRQFVIQLRAGAVLQCVAVCCSLLQCVAVCCSASQSVAVCCSVLQSVAVCCSMLHMCPAVGHSTARW